MRISKNQLSAHYPSKKLKIATKCNLTVAKAFNCFGVNVVGQNLEKQHLILKYIQYIIDILNY